MKYLKFYLYWLMKHNFITYYCINTTLGIYSLFLFLFNKKSFILNYHSIDDANYIFNKPIFITKRLLTIHLKIIKSLGFKIVMLENITELDFNKNKYCILTFDDGYKNNINFFKSLDVPITIFINNDFLTSYEISLWWIELERNINLLNMSLYKKNIVFNKCRNIILKNEHRYKKLMRRYFKSKLNELNFRDYFLSKQELIHLNNITNIKFASHYYYHKNINIFTDKEFSENINQANIELKNILNDKYINFFAYPYGIEEENSSFKNKYLLTTYDKLFTTRYGFIDDNSKYNNKICRISVSEADGILGFINKISASYTLLYKIFK